MRNFDDLLFAFDALRAVTRADWFRWSSDAVDSVHDAELTIWAGITEYVACDPEIRLFWNEIEICDENDNEGWQMCWWFEVWDNSVQICSSATYDNKDERQMYLNRFCSLLGRDAFVIDLGCFDEWYFKPQFTQG